MLKISETGLIGQAPLPPTTQEILAFNRHVPGCIEVTVENFRLDLHHKRTSPFNLTAQAVFADDFRTKVLEEKWYSYPGIPKRFLNCDYIKYYLRQHMKHLKKMYCEKVVSHDPLHTQLRLKKALRGGCKYRV